MWQYNYNYPNYLAHYGVLGMKWGVRKAKQYQAQVNKYQSKYNNAKTYVGKSIRNAQLTNATARLNVQKRQNASTGLRAYANIGYGADRSSANVGYHNRAKSYAKTRIGRTAHDNKAKNAAKTAVLYNKISDTKGLSNKGKTYVNDFMNTKYNSWSGRSITRGQYTVENMLGVYGVSVANVRDMNYYLTHK